MVMLEHVLLIEQDLSSHTPDSNIISRISNKAEKRFEESVKLCKKNPSGFLRMCVAFWNHKPSDMAIIQVLKREKSTICVDIHSPTNIDELGALVVAGVKNIYLFLYRNGTSDHQQLPLLHSKIFLFNFGDGKAEIWTGSQNFTYSALGGMNCESIHILKTTVDSNIYSEVNEYIDFIKQCCEDVQGQFDLEERDFYKKLQKSQIRDNPLHVLDVLGTQGSFSKGDSIVLMVDLASNDKRVTESDVILRVLSSEQKLIQYNAKVEFTRITTSEHAKELGTREKSLRVGFIIRANSMIPLLRKWDNDIQEILREIEEISSKIGLIAIIEIIRKIDDKENLSSERTEVWRDLESESGYRYAKSLSLPTTHRNNIQIPRELSVQQDRTHFDDLIECEPNVLKRCITELSEYYESELELLRQKPPVNAPTNTKTKKPKLMEQKELLRKMHWEQKKGMKDIFNPG